jgi:hypothetical protein
MAKKARRSPDPLPPLKWDGYTWTGQIVLRSWGGFQTRQGPYFRRSSDQPSDGTARLSIHGEDGDPPAPPNQEQVAAYRYLVEQEKAVSDSVLQAIFAAYPDEREAFIDAVEDDLADLCPEIDRPDELKSLIGLGLVHILPVVRDGTAYVGFAFGCVWDGEHALGVLTHTDRVILVGAAETAFNSWIARADAQPEGTP